MLIMIVVSLVFAFAKASTYDVITIWLRFLLYKQINRLIVAIFSRSVVEGIEHLLLKR